MPNRVWVAAVLGVIVVLGIASYVRRPQFKFVPNDTAVTIPEGTNLADIERIIEGSGIKIQNRLLTKANLALEGTLFPDTYRFDRNSTAEAIIARMHREYPDQTILTIASLLEKEVRSEYDMRVVAGIIKKRAAAGMGLQIDASVAYGACLPAFTAGTYCDVSKINLVDNIRKDSAYNTYTRRGLPPGPITNPGSVALRAAASPIASEYWYYLSTPDGTTIFSKTLEEHNRARARYLR